MNTVVTIIPVASVGPISTPRSRQRPGGWQLPGRTPYKPATEDVLLSCRVVEHPMIAASVIRTLCDALSAVSEPAVDIETFALRLAGLGAAEALARNDIETAQRLLALHASQEKPPAQAER